MTFRVGQKVVCVDDDFYDPGLCEPLHLPCKGSVYTLRDPFSADGWTWWRLVEITNSPVNVKYGMIEPCFSPRHFRPVTETKTDISIFTKMLTPRRERVPIA